MAVKKKTKAQLERQVIELEAQLYHAYYFANQYLPKAGQKYFMASGVVLTLTAIGGKEIVSPVVIKDGLSDETITAIRNDLIRSQKLAGLFVIKEE